jgi:hypothetical protein
MNDPVLCCLIIFVSLILALVIFRVQPRFISDERTGVMVKLSDYSLECLENLVLTVILGSSLALDLFAVVVEPVSHLKQLVLV